MQQRPRVQQSASNFRFLPLQAKDRTWTNCAVTLSVSGGSRSQLCLDQRVCVVIVAKNVLCLAQVVFSYSVLNSSKIPLVLTINQSYTFAQPAVQTSGVQRSGDARATAWLDAPYQILVLSTGAWWSLLLNIGCVWRHNMTSYSSLQPTLWRSLLTKHAYLGTLEQR